METVGWDRSHDGISAGRRTVWVSRHAKTDANEASILQGWDPYELSVTGQSDAARAATWWQARPVTWVISSPVLRAMRTAQIMLGRVDDLDSSWGEQAMPGMAGASVQDNHRRFPELVRPDGWSRQDAPRSDVIEHISTVEDRAIGALRRSGLRQVDSHTAVVTHGAVLAALLRAAGVDAPTVGNLAVAEFEVDPTVGWRLLAVHDPLVGVE